ncbi:MAG: hypothetical protein ACLQDV_06150 [Candidatus Binataceae bacterium]
MIKIASIGFAIVLTAVIALPCFADDVSQFGEICGSANGMGAHLHLGEHMKVTELRPQTPQDVERAIDVAAKLRRALLPYNDYRVALAQGFRIFLPNVPQDVYHFTDYAAAGAEYQGHFDPEHPGAILYTRNRDGEYVLVGAMYSAPADYTPDQLDELIPLGVARWHQHVNICLPNGITLTDLLDGEVGAKRTDVPGMLPIAANPMALDLDRRVGFLADGRFGFEGAIQDAATCETAGGHFIPLAFGWMVHVYPFVGDNLKVEYGMDVPAQRTD